jgi:exonuclease VII large subunit
MGPEENSRERGFSDNGQEVPLGVPKVTFQGDQARSEVLKAVRQAGEREKKTRQYFPIE